MEMFAGTGVALVTPFDENLNIDERSLRRLVNYVIEGGVDFWWFWGLLQKLQH